MDANKREQLAPREPKPLGLIWMYCPYPVLWAGLAEVLKADAFVLGGQELPKFVTPSYIVYCPNSGDIATDLEAVRAAAPHAPLLVYSPAADTRLARAASRAGASGFIHAQMRPDQIRSVLHAAGRDKVVPPKSLEAQGVYVDGSDQDAPALSAQKLKILELVADGLTNAEIARTLFLTESTIKQHLRAIYKTLGVRNRTQAARWLRESRWSPDELAQSIDTRPPIMAARLASLTETRVSRRRLTIVE